MRLVLNLMVWGKQGSEKKTQEAALKELGDLMAQAKQSVAQEDKEAAEAAVEAKVCTLLHCLLELVVMACFWPCSLHMLITKYDGILLGPVVVAVAAATLLPCKSLGS